MASGRNFALMLIRDPVLQELNRRMVAERGVAATPVVEHFDVIEQIGSRVLPRRVACAMCSRRLQIAHRLRIDQHQQSGGGGQ